MLYCKILRIDISDEGENFFQTLADGKCICRSVYLYMYSIRPPQEPHLVIIQCEYWFWWPWWREGGRGGGGGGKFNIVRDYPPGKLARINFLTL